MRNRIPPSGVDIVNTSLTKSGVGILVTGVVLMVFGLIIASIPVTQEECVTFIIQVCEDVTTYPYAPLGGVMFFIGLILLIVGAIVAGVGASSKPSSEVPPTQPYPSGPVGTQQQSYAYPQAASPPPPPAYQGQQPQRGGFCSQCGSPRGINEVFCPHCGRKF